jgi:hypothetical protein
MRCPSGDHATLLTVSECPSSVCKCLPLAASHRCIVLYSDEAKRCPSGDHATLLTLLVFSCETCTHTPLRASQIRMFPSAEAEARYAPSGDHTIRPIQLECPRKTWRRVTPGTGEPPISVKSGGRGSSCSFGSSSSGGGVEVGFGLGRDRLRCFLLIEAAPRRMRVVCDVPCPPSR